MGEIPAKRFFRPDEVRIILGYKSVRSIYRLIKLRKIKTQRRGRTLWIEHDEVARAFNGVTL